MKEEFANQLTAFILSFIVLYFVNPAYVEASNSYYQLEDPLFEELLTDQPGTCKSVPYWGYNTDEDLFRSYALKFGHRWSLGEQYDEMKQYHLIPMYYPEKCQEYDVPFLLPLESTHAEVPLVITTGKKRPWILDPRIEERFLKDAEEKLTQWAGKGLWGFFVGDEVYSLATQVVPENARYGFIREANEEIKRDYGFGKYGMPESDEDSNPFRWIAYKRWVTDKLKERYAKLYKQVKLTHPNVVIVGPDPAGNVPPDDYSGFAPFIDIAVGQAINNLQSPYLAHKLMVGYATKSLVDLSGKPAYTTVQCCDYLGSPTPEHIRERFSQVFRNGGSGVFLLAVEWFDRELNHHKYASPLRWLAILEICKHITSMNKVRIPNDPDIAILYSSDSLSARHGSSLPEEMLSAYCITGPLCRTWFEFVDDRQIERNIKKLEQYKILIVPYAKYERSNVVHKIIKFVERGGILICTDPEAFSFDINGDSSDHLRRSLFGIRNMCKRPYLQGVIVNNRNMPAHDRGFYVFLDEKVRVLGAFQDHYPALIAKKAGTGEIIYFAFNPFTIQAPEEPVWIDFWRDLFKRHGIKIGRDIWRFKFPPFEALDIDVPKGKCLTNNHAFFKENLPNMKKNAAVKGSYYYSLAPNFVQEGNDNGGKEGIPFPLGHLTNRLEAIAERITGRWVGPVDTHPWVVSWKEREPFSITFDLKRSYHLDKAKIFYSGQIPEVIIEGSINHTDWTFLAKSDSKPFTSAVLDKSYNLQGDWQYLKFSFGQGQNGETDQDSQLILSEIEIWGE